MASAIKAHRNLSLTLCFIFIEKIYHNGKMANVFFFFFRLDLTIIRVLSSLFVVRCILCAIFGQYDRILRGHDLNLTILTFCLNGKSQMMADLKFGFNHFGSKLNDSDDWAACWERRCCCCYSTIVCCTNAATKWKWILSIFVGCINWLTVWIIVIIAMNSFFFFSFALSR